MLSSFLKTSFWNIQVPLTIQNNFLHRWQDCHAAKCVRYITCVDKNWVAYKIWCKREKTLIFSLPPLAPKNCASSLTMICFCLNIGLLNQHYHSRLPINLKNKLWDCMSNGTKLEIDLFLQCRQNFYVML